MEKPAQQFQDFADFEDKPVTTTTTTKQNDLGGIQNFGVFDDFEEVKA